jgi:hypothetical protein
MEGTGHRLRLRLRLHHKPLDALKKKNLSNLFRGLNGRKKKMTLELKALLDRVYARCIPDVHGCMNWTGAGTRSGKSPEIKRPDIEGSVSLRRWMLDVAGKKVHVHRRATYLCGNFKCVRLEHIGSITKTTLQKRSNSEFDAAAKLKKSSRISVKARARSKITPEMAKEIFESNEHQRALAKRYGVAQSTICQIKNGKAWGDLNNHYLRLAA